MYPAGSDHVRRLHSQPAKTVELLKTSRTVRVDHCGTNVKGIPFMASGTHVVDIRKAGDQK